AGREQCPVASVAPPTKQEIDVVELGPGALLRALTVPRDPFGELLARARARVERRAPELSTERDRLELGAPVRVLEPHAPELGLEPRRILGQPIDVAHARRDRPADAFRPRVRIAERELQERA